MDYFIDLDQTGFSTEELEDIQLCLETLLSVEAGEQPLDRDFGISCDMISDPTNIAKNKLSLEIIDKVAKYEPRVEVESVTFDSEEDGQLAPKIHFKKAED